MNTRIIYSRNTIQGIWGLASLDQPKSALRLKGIKGLFTVVEVNLPWLNPSYQNTAISSLILVQLRCTLSLLISIL